METALYVHFPFCVRKCLYCDFNSVADSSITREEYVAAVVREMEMQAALLGEKASVTTIYFGGGTPSLMASAEAERLLDSAAKLFQVDPHAEVTLEANPGTVTPSTLQGYRQAGVNRLSLGVQSFQDRFLEILGRVHSAADAVKALEWARHAGFDNVGIDLIHSLPGQDIHLWQADLEQAVRLAPEHISAYGLSVEEGTPFHALQTAGKLDLPREEEAARMLEVTSAFLGDHGYPQYEISNFSRPGFSSRHNTNYWHRGNYLGFGSGAHSFLRFPRFGRRWSNCPDLSRYLAAISSGEGWGEEEAIVNEREAMGEYLFLGLRLLEGVDEGAFRAEFGSSIDAVFPAEVEWLLRNGLLERKGARLALMPRALPVANQVFMRFV